jgi:hypothetical protein
MANLRDLSEIDPIRVWEDVRVRRVQGDQVTLAVG